MTSMRQMSILYALVFLFFFVSSKSTCCSNCGGTSALNVDKSLEYQRCSQKKICTIPCECKQVAFFDLNGTPLANAYQNVCVLPKRRKVERYIHKSLSKQIKSRKFYTSMAVFAETIQRLSEKGIILAPGIAAFPRDVLSIEWRKYKKSLSFTLKQERHFDKLAQQIISVITRIYVSRCSCKKVFKFTKKSRKEFKNAFNRATSICARKCFESRPKIQRTKKISC